MASSAGGSISYIVLTLRHFMGTFDVANSTYPKPLAQIILYQPGKDAWVELKVVIDLNANTQTIFYDDAVGFDFGLERLARSTTPSSRKILPFQVLGSPAIVVEKSTLLPAPEPRATSSHF